MVGGFIYPIKIFFWIIVLLILYKFINTIYLISPLPRLGECWWRVLSGCGGLVVAGRRDQAAVEEDQRPTLALSPPQVSRPPTLISTQGADTQTLVQ